MPQDKKLSYKDYVSGKGSYDDKFSGTIGQYDPEGFYEGKRASRVEAGGRHAQRETNEGYAMNKRGALGMFKQLSSSLSAARNNEKAGRAKGMSEIDAMRYGTQAAENSRPSFDRKTRVAKPLSAAAGAKMVSAMSGKSNGTFAGGSPRSSMSKNLKIK
jgi:hypothetical protein